ncbi:MAG TPA: outer membrane lipoprotein carrier protein LolA [Sedimentisphaerales bacterium]|jgi:outer membrane lipoprotein-sorting protein|nr:outer membrane lipoprotein carrier protein LolA [Sedimentisphaerales bacterium]HNU31081.1 outer membrane lipoprotein carrier protein LolA [Sedimentisphaerales bacterium]
MRGVVVAGFITGLMAVGAAGARIEDPNTPTCCPVAANDSNEVDRALQRLQDKAAGLKSYQANVDYVTKQPLLESQARRTGTLHYAKSQDRSSLRVNFLTLQQDEEPEQRYIEQFLFDGVWLVIVNHQTERVERRQLTEPNQPVDAFSLASRHMPVIGFSKTEDLKKQFDVAIVSEPDDPADLQHLRLHVRPDCAYSADYTQIDFWVDPKVGLPARITAVTTEEDVHEIRLLQPRINEGIDPRIFRPEVPKGFAVEVIPLEEKPRNP